MKLRYYIVIIIFIVMTAYILTDRQITLNDSKKLHESSILWDYGYDIQCEPRFQQKPNCKIIDESGNRVPNEKLLETGIGCWEEDDVGYWLPCKID